MVTVSCGGNDNDTQEVVERYCEKLAECDYLREGVSADYCTDLFRVALDHTDDEARSDVERETDEVEACLKLSCSQFSQCVDEV